MRRGLYTVEFEPVVQAGDYIKLFPEDVFGNTLYVVAEPPVAYPVAAVVDIGPIDPNGETSLVEIDDLALPPNWIGQWRMMLVDDFKISEMRYRGKAGQAAFALKNNVGFVTKESAKDGWLTEFFTWRDDKIYVRGYNIHDFKLGKARIKFSGYAFKIEPVTGMVEKPYTRIYIGFEKVA